MWKMAALKEMRFFVHKFCVISDFLNKGTELCYTKFCLSLPCIEHYGSKAIANLVLYVSIISGKIWMVLEVSSINQKRHICNGFVTFNSETCDFTSVKLFSAVTNHIAWVWPRFMVISKWMPAVSIMLSSDESTISNQLSSWLSWFCMMHTFR